MNEHSLPGTPLYNRFFAAWAAVPDKSMRLVFHGTPERNIDAICRDGLDPKLRHAQALGPGEYCGRTAQISINYCRGGKKMLVFAILTDPSGVTRFKGRVGAGIAGIAVIHKPEHQLPLAIVTFDPAKLRVARSSRSRCARRRRRGSAAGRPAPPRSRAAVAAAQVRRALDVAATAAALLRRRRCPLLAAAAAAAGALARPGRSLPRGNAASSVD